MSKFKIGDRVAVYSGSRYTGIVGVLDGDRDQSVWVQLDEGLKADWFHPKQCRKLVKKQRREFWLLFDRFKAPLKCAPEPIEKIHEDDEIIHVREIRIKNK